MQNAIERRVAKVEALWNEFVLDGQRNKLPILCRFKGDGGELQVVDAFLRLQEEPIGTSPDLFVRFQVPFEISGTYVDALTQDFCEQFEGSREAIDASGLDASWKPPARRREAGSFGYLNDFFSSVITAYGDDFRCLVLVLTPSEVVDFADFSEWIDQLSRFSWPNELRFLITDAKDFSAFDNFLVESNSVLTGFCSTIELQLDMENAISELMRKEIPEGPGKDFLLATSAITSMSSKKNMTGARRATDRAIAIATQEGWREQKVVAFAALAAGYLNASMPDEAVDEYDKAIKIARDMENSDEPTGPRLVMMMTALRGTSLFSKDAYKDAAAAYLESYQAAQRVPDPIFEMDSLRMIALCNELSGDKGKAWEFGKEAMEVAKKIPAERRKETSLPYVGEGLLRIMRGHDEEKRYCDEVRAGMTDLLGEPWHGPKEVAT